MNTKRPGCTGTRRQFLLDTGMGFTGLALNAMMFKDGVVQAAPSTQEVLTAWQTGETDHSCAALPQLAKRSASSGTALADGAAQLAEHERQRVLQRAAAAAERAGVLIAGPLGLCFLPAFVCLGIVPVVAGLAGEIFGAGPQ